MVKVTKNTTHGLSHTPEYMAWGNMIQRCTNPNYIYYSDYGGRGIAVCDRWRGSFQAFISDMGLRPTAEHSVERRDVNGNYEPSNCFWATKEEQANNTRRNVFYCVDGVKLSESQLTRTTGVSPQTLRHRLSKGIPLQEALHPQKRNVVLHSLNGESLPLKDWATRSGVGYQTLYKRIHVQGLSLEEAISAPHRSRRKQD